jgi:chromosome segregation ATPase
MVRKNGLILIASAILFSGCATTASECDPAVRKNMVTTASCIFGDHYQTRQLSKEAELKEQTIISESLRQIYTLLEEQQRGVVGNLTTTRNQYKQLNTTLNSLIAQISVNSQGNQALQQKIEDLKKKQSYVNSSTSNTQKQHALDSLYTEVENLRGELGYN